MFNQIALVRIIDMQNEADRRRWRKDENAYYEDLGYDAGYRLLRFWRRIRFGAAAEPDKKTDPQLPTGPLFNTCDDGTNQAAR